jgi:hypothetical protein
MLIEFRNFLTFCLGTQFFFVTAQNLSRDSNSPKLYLLPLEAILGTKTKQKG